MNNTPEILRLAAFIILPALVVMGLITWAIKRQHDPMILDRKREREARARRRENRKSVP
ncbi:hypothetical protein [Actomonas aquatica]|uniref:Uncharacterized protein n=1 Tax=Actomonas aquatica TaxID=2866162 RepID=A0ABZ1C385_9BACT|nr:hypothetical protein [Opitutus sp. WL0086]WRQ85802.1 hypothetical protein K1X11_013400 [Opitutus sp. WL0086]